MSDDEPEREETECAEKDAEGGELVAVVPAVCVASQRAGSGAVTLGRDALTVIGHGLTFFHSDLVGAFHMSELMVEHEDEPPVNDAGQFICGRVCRDGSPCQIRVPMAYFACHRHDRCDLIAPK
jgi:hypothetical protein